MDNDNDQGQIFLLAWDMHGLETAINITELESENTMLVLKDEPITKLSHILFSLTSRARYNCHRHYEIYSIRVSRDISTDDIRDLFEKDPNGSAELIRSRGIKIYSDRLPLEKQLIR